MIIKNHISHLEQGTIVSGVWGELAIGDLQVVFCEFLQKSNLNLAFMTILALCVESVMNLLVTASSDPKFSYLPKSDVELVGLPDEISHLRDIKCLGSIRCLTKSQISINFSPSKYQPCCRMTNSMMKKTLLFLLILSMVRKRTCGSLSSSWSLTRPSSCSYKTTKDCQPT